MYICINKKETPQEYHLHDKRSNKQLDPLWKAMIPYSRNDGRCCHNKSTLAGDIASHDEAKSDLAVKVEANNRVNNGDSLLRKDS